MAIKSIQYETLLSACTSHQGALDLLKCHRPYLEAVPSVRRPQDSIVTLPLPNVRVRETAHINPKNPAIGAGKVVTLLCDVALIMCDPEWKIKTGMDILVYIHRPQEDFSQLLRRWRQTQILLDQGYEWLMPQQYQHLLSDGTEAKHPLFVLFPQTPKRIYQGLKGAGLPAVIFPFTDPVAAAPEDHELTLDDIDDPIAGVEAIDPPGFESPYGDL
jgi:hypothetical protein